MPRATQAAIAIGLALRGERVYAERMSVLGTKLHLPSPRHRLVQRARLTDQMRVDGGEAPRLVLVAAPAGFGKTTFLAQWLASERLQRSVAWLALDPGDADLRVFLTHLVAAIQTAEPEAGIDALAGNADVGGGVAGTVPMGLSPGCTRPPC